MERPTSTKRLDELTGLIEEMTTGGNMELSPDDAGDIYLWLDWIRELLKHKPEDRGYQSGPPWGD